jgi:hypothetical protein
MLAKSGMPSRLCLAEITPDILGIFQFRDSPFPQIGNSAMPRPEYIAGQGLPFADKQPTILLVFKQLAAPLWTPFNAHALH